MWCKKNFFPQQEQWKQVFKQDNDLSNTPRHDSTGEETAVIFTDIEFSVLVSEGRLQHIMRVQAVYVTPHFKLYYAEENKPYNKMHKCVFLIWAVKSCHSDFSLPSVGKRWDLLQTPWRENVVFYQVQEIVLEHHTGTNEIHTSYWHV